MRRFFQVFVGLLLFILLPFFVKGQTVVKTALSTGKLKHYKGRIDDINDITVSLTCDGIICQGSLVYLRSRDEFKLQGTLKGNQLQLQEFNRTKSCTGYLTGRIEGTSIHLDWKNKEGDIGHIIKLKEVAKKPDFPTFCGDNKWINAYSAIIKGEVVNIILQRVDNNRILGSAYFKNKKERVLIQGALSENNTLHLNLLNEVTSIPMGSLRGIYNDNQNLSTSFYTNQNNQSFVALRLEKKIATSCLEYADYYTSYDFLFPKTDNAVFNELMVLLTKDWIEDCRKNSQTARKHQADITTRASQRAYSWTDLALLNDNFISGMLTYQATWAEKEITKTFNYELESSEVLTLNKIFKKGFNYQQYIKKYVAEEIIKSAIYKNNKHYRNWVKNQEFQFFTLGHAGISFYTEYHIIYDRQRITIPYKKLKGNIRKNSPVRKLF